MANDGETGIEIQLIFIHVVIYKLDIWDWAKKEELNGTRIFN